MKIFKVLPFFLLLLGLQCPRKGVIRKVLVPLSEPSETIILKTERPISTLNETISNWLKYNSIGEGKPYSSNVNVLNFVSNESDIPTIFSTPEQSNPSYEIQTCFKFYVDVKALGFIPENVENNLCTQLTSNNLISLSVVQPEVVSREANEIFQKLSSHISSMPTYEFVSYGKITIHKKLKN